MTKACYVGVAGKARKVKKIYTGVADKARKVKKAYVGVGGKARLFYSAEQKLGYYGTVTALSQARNGLAATTVGSYGLFGGGIISFKCSAVVDAYSSSLVRSTPTALSQARSSCGATTVGGYALFGGGIIDMTVSGYDIINTNTAIVDAYSSSLVRSTPTALSQARSYIGATSVGVYALFGGGYGKGSSEGCSTVDAYSSSLVRSTPTALSQARGYIEATSVGVYALFGGGYAPSGRSATVDAYNLV